MHVFPTAGFSPISRADGTPSPNAKVSNYRPLFINSNRDHPAVGLSPRPRLLQMKPVKSLSIRTHRRDHYLVAPVSREVLKKGPRRVRQVGLVLHHIGSPRYR